MKKIILITFKEQAKTYEAFSQLKSISKTNQFEIKQVTVIQKSDNGETFSIKDSLDYESGKRITTGGIIGAIVGILGGPLGVLCGWIVGDLAGVGTNYIKSKKERTIFDSIANQLHNNELGLLLLVDEADTSLLDTIIVEKLDGEIDRIDYDSAKEDVETAKNHLN